MKYVSPRLLVSASTIAMMALTTPHNARAQSASASSTNGASTDTGASNGGGGLDEVVVTARKRSEVLLDVPVSVAAFDSQKLEQEGIYTFNDIADITPGFAVDNEGATTSRTDRSLQTLIVRGMTPGQASTTTIFIDGAPISSGFIDGIDALDRVEILKGPQSAYFGRATFAGAVNLVTKKPSDDFKLSADLLVGDYNWVDARVTAEGAVVPGVLGVRLSLRDYSQTGQWKNNGDLGGTLGDQSTKSANLAIDFNPTDTLSINVFGDYWQDSDGPGTTGLLLNYDCATPTASHGVPNYFCGKLPMISASQPASDTRIDPILQKYLLDNPAFRNTAGPSQFTDHGGLERNAYHVHGEINYEIPDWGITITSLTSANMDHFSVIQDLDNQASTGIPNPYAFLGIPGQEKFTNWVFDEGEIMDDVSQELRITSAQDQRFRWVFGLNYTHELNSSANFANIPFGPLSADLPIPLYVDTYSTFGSLSYDVLDNLTVSFDARYQLDHQATYAEQLTGPNVFEGSANFRSFSPRVIVQYKVDPDLMLYASWSEGANVGLLNTGLEIGLAPAELAAVESKYGLSLNVLPEETQQYEVGVKGRFWDNRITVSTDIYAGTWTNQIVSVPYFYQKQGGPLSEAFAFSNVGKTDLFGWEFDGAIKPIDHLVINGTAGFAGTNIRNYSCETCVSVTGTTNVKGSTLPNYPAWQANIGVEWSDELPTFEGWNYYVRGEANYKGINWVDYENYAYIPASLKANFRVGVKSGGYWLEGFVLNAFNDKTYTSGTQNSNLLSPGFAGLAIPVGLPVLRQFGVRLRYSFEPGHGETAATPAAYTPPPVQAPTPAMKAARSYMVFFDFNRSDLTAQAVSIVDQAARNAAPAKATELVVTGHTDTVGSDAYNMRLSRRRAESVAAELEKQGIKSSEIEIVAKGKKDLLVPTADGVREPQNRRVQIVYSGGASS
jgi:iron complex outermembrane receptor protein